MTRIFSLEECDGIANLLKDWSIQIQSICDRATTHGLKAIEVERGGQSWETAKQRMTGYINALNKAIATAIEEQTKQKGDI